MIYSVQLQAQAAGQEVRSWPSSNEQNGQEGVQINRTSTSVPSAEQLTFDEN